MLAEEARKCVFFLVGNIPAKLRSADLRAFFSHLVEARGFVCFHFRHRPEHNAPAAAGAAVGVSDTGSMTPTDVESLSATTTDCRESERGGEQAPATATTRCCVAAVRSEHGAELVRRYSDRHWTTGSGGFLRRKVRLTKLPVLFDDAKKSSGLVSGSVSLSGFQRGIPWSDLSALPELNPPSVMPSGNVGTPTAVFLDLIHQCKLPGKVIRKLNLEFPKSRSKRRYGAVWLDYGNEKTVDESSGREAERETEMDREQLDEREREDEIQYVDDEKQEIELIPSDDEHDAEEWERYEALHNDVDKQGRTKERLYEEEMEVVWEKGGSGLVFYTDTSYWHNLEGDFDEQCAKEDDWDVDTALYYDREGGDKEARDMRDMRQEQSARDGVQQASVFAGFERYTKGIGSKVLKRSGWTEGSGVGKTTEGRSEPVDTEGQHPHNKTGLGYRGEKLVRHWPQTAKRPRRATRDVIISTVYDRPEEEETTVLRSAPPRTIKYRQPGIQFVAGKPLVPHSTSTEPGTSATD